MSQTSLRLCLVMLTISILDTVTLAADLPKLTTLSNRELQFQRASEPYVGMRRGPVKMVVVTNEAVDNEVLSGHRAGYSGVASLTHEARPQNVFVPAYAGLNFEHIHDGTKRNRDVLFEPRRVPMELRIIDEYTCELYQAPTPHWKLESVLRYHLLPDGTIEMTLECIPRAKTFTQGYVGLFWASYIQSPPSKDIFFLGKRDGQAATAPSWVRGRTPRHGVLATHVGLQDQRVFPHDRDFPLTLAFNRSHFRYTEPWYYGLSHDMALVFMFRPQDHIRLTQSPSGGGTGNPAWDFQYFAEDYEVGKRYQMVMRTLYTPFKSVEQIHQDTLIHRQALTPAGR